MFDIESYHNEHSQSDGKWILDEIGQSGEVEDGTTSQADHMAANDVSCLCGVGFGHCEYDEGSCPHSADYDHFFFTESENDDEQCNGGEEALQEVIEPKVFEFLADCHFCSCHKVDFAGFFMFCINHKQRKERRGMSNWGCQVYTLPRRVCEILSDFCIDPPWSVL